MMPLAPWFSAILSFSRANFLSLYFPPFLKQEHPPKVIMICLVSLVRSNQSTHFQMAALFWFREGYIQAGQMVPTQTLLQLPQQQLIVDPNGTAAAQQPTTFAIQASDGSLIPVQLATSPNGGPLIMLMQNTGATTAQAAQPIYSTQAITGATATAATLDASGQATVITSGVDDENNQAVLQQQAQHAAAGQVQIVHQPGVTASQATSQVIQQTASQQSAASAGMGASAMGSEEPLYVNAKQYNRILKRRQARGRLEAQGRIPKERRKYLHESRHQHAIKRIRNAGGRFFSSSCKYYLSSVWRLRMQFLIINLVGTM